MFTDSIRSEDGSGDRWLVDIAPMLNDSSIKQTLGDLDLDVPQTLTVPITVPESSALRPGQLRPLSTWGPWVSVGSTILAGVSALLMLAAARSRGKALAALGVSALLVGAAGWAGLEVARRYVDDALNQTTGDIRQIADVMVAHAEGSLPPLAEPHAGRRRCAGGVRGGRVDARRPAPAGIAVTRYVQPCHSSRTSRARSSPSRPGDAGHRCTSPNQHHRHASGADRRFRRRPAGARCGGAAQDGVDVLGEIRVRAHLSERVIDDIGSTPHDGAAGAAAGQSGRARVPLDGGQAASRRGAARQPAAPAARRLGRCGPGVGLLGAARGDHSGHRGEAACRHRRQDGGHLRGVRTRGLARRLRPAQRHHSLGARPGRAAADWTALHAGRTAARTWHAAVPAARPASRRRRIRRISMPTSATRTSTATASRRSCTSTPSRARWIPRREPSPSVTADVRVLPWQECPGAIGSATRVRGMTLSELREPHPW